MAHAKANEMNFKEGTRRDLGAPKFVAVALACLFLSSGLTVSRVYAQYGEESDRSSMAPGDPYVVPGTQIRIPPGMELLKSGDINIVVPKGARLHKVNDLTLIESAEEYAARKFEIAEARLDRLEDELAGMRKELKELHREIREQRTEDPDGGGGKKS